MKYVALLGLFVATVLLGCATNQTHEIVDGPTSSASPGPSPTGDDEPVTVSTPENISLADKSPEYLCDHLIELKHNPWDPNDFSGDAVYDALKRKGRESLPCLVEKITDTHAAENPTGAPFWAGLTYRVGDTAVLMLMNMNDMYWPKGMLAKKYEDMFQSEGMFSYYFYVHEVPGARKAVQRWWRNWLKYFKPECDKVPPIK